MMGWLLLGLMAGLVISWGIWGRPKIKLYDSESQSRKPQWLGWSSEASRLTRTIANYKQANLSLQEDIFAWQNLIQAAPIGFLQVDEDNQLVFCNAKACELLGLENAKSDQSRLLLELVRSFELDELIEQTRHAQKACEREWLFHPVDADFTKLTQQQSRALRGYGFPMQRGHVGVFVESREEVMMLARQRDRWISDAAHELKTPLTSIRLVAETLIPRVEPRMQEWVERLLREAIRLSNLVQDLLDLNYLQVQPNGRLLLKPLDLARMIQSAWLSLEPLAREKQVQLDYQGTEQFMIQADETRLHRVLLNLLDNSIKYSPGTERIQVKLGLMNDPRDFATRCAHLQVIDAGPGFPEDALPFVFDRFYRADPSRTRQKNSLDVSQAIEPDSATAPSSLRKRQQKSTLEFVSLNSGSGLGLAIVQQIVEAHGGFVTASNHPETGGAWLQVFLPWQPLE